MRHLIQNSKSVFTLLLAAVLLLNGTAFSGSLRKSMAENTQKQISQGPHSSGLTLADDWDCDDFI